MNSANRSQQIVAPTATAQSTAQNDVDQLPRHVRDAIQAFEALCTYNTNHRAADDADKSTPFHSVSEPPISIDKYAARFMRYLTCSDHGVLMGIIFAARYCACAKLPPSRLTMHRLLLTGTLLGVKCHHDRFSSNKCFARIGGVSLQEMNALEILMFHGIGFRMRIDDIHLQNVTAASRRIHDILGSNNNATRSIAEVAAFFSEPSIRVLENAFYPIDEPAEVIPDRVPMRTAIKAMPTSDDDDDSSWAADGLQTNPSFGAVSPSRG